MTIIHAILEKRYSSYQKYHLTEMAHNINGTTQKGYQAKLERQNLYYWFFEVLATPY